MFMYRSAARRLVPALCRQDGRIRNHVYKPVTHQEAASESAQRRNPNNLEFPNSAPSTDGGERRVVDRPKTHWQEEQARVLQASLRHVNTLGWSDASIIAGASEVGVSPSIVGSFPRKEAVLVEFFMDDCLQRLIDVTDMKEDSKTLTHSSRVAKLVRLRLEMQAPYVSNWPQALSTQAKPSNISTSFNQRAMLVDEIWHASGDGTTEIDWYVKRTILGGIYSATELYMLTDNSQDFQDTWLFLEGRVKDSFDLKKSVQEAKYLVEAVGAGVGGFVKNILKG